MKIPTTEHTARPWLIHELTPDFTVEDVWALPTPGGPDDFPRLLDGIGSSDFPEGAPAVVRVLWDLRWRLGALFGWDRPDRGLGVRAGSLRERLPAELRDGPTGPDLPRFDSLYLRDDEWAAELANGTVHAVLHLGWVPDGAGGHRGQMAVLVKPNGAFGRAYMAAIKPFRYAFVYPALMRTFARGWEARTPTPGDPTPTGK
jgi:hypothetical protein